jgi:hypothetical protein
MDAAEILDQLTHAKGLPKAALHAATAQHAEMVPIFLQEIDSYLALEPADRAKPTPLFFIVHLLGEWREKAACRPLVRLLRCADHEVEAILGDGITSTSHRVMAAVFDGDPQPIYDIILDRNAEQFVRSRMCETLAMLVLRGELEREVVGRFLRDAFMEMQPQAQCYVWQGWQSAIAMLGLVELKMLVKRAFDRGFIDRHWIGFEEFQHDVEWTARHPRWPCYRRTTNTLCSATPLRNCPAGTGSATRDVRIAGGYCKKLKPSLPRLSRITIHSEGSAATIHVLAAAGGAFKMCCLSSNLYDGAARHYYF